MKIKFVKDFKQLNNPQHVRVKFMIKMAEMKFNKISQEFYDSVKICNDTFIIQGNNLLKLYSYSLHFKLVSISRLQSTVLAYLPECTPRHFWM